MTIDILNDLDLLLHSASSPSLRGPNVFNVGVIKDAVGESLESLTTGEFEGILRTHGAQGAASRSEEDLAILIATTIHAHALLERDEMRLAALRQQRAELFHDASASNLSIRLIAEHSNLGTAYVTDVLKRFPDYNDLGMMTTLEVEGETISLPFKVRAQCDVRSSDSASWTFLFYRGDGKYVSGKDPRKANVIVGRELGEEAPVVEDYFRAEAPGFKAIREWRAGDISPSALPDDLRYARKRKAREGLYDWFAQQCGDELFARIVDAYA